MKTFNQSSENARSQIFLLFAAAVLIVLPFYFLGLFNGIDIGFHFQFADVFYKAFQAGDFYPGWAADDNFGYGSLKARLYPPLTAMLMALTRMLVGDWHLAACLNLLFYTFVGSLGVYLWAKELLPARAAFWAGLIFALMPYRLSEIYNGYVYGEYAGSAFLPFCFLFTSKICAEGKARHVFGLTVAYGLLFLTHLPLTVIGSPCLLIYALLVMPKTGRVRCVLKLAGAVSLSLLSTSAYWLRWVPEMHLFRMTKLNPDNYFEYDYNFLLTSPWFDEKILWYLNLVFFSTLIFSTAFFFAFHKTRGGEYRKDVRAAFAIFAASIFMTLVISQPVWMLLPFLQEIQFPWRWLTVSSVCGALIAGAGVEPFLEILKGKLAGRANLWIKFTCSAGVLLLAAALCLTWMFYTVNRLPTDEFEEWVQKETRAIGLYTCWTVYTNDEIFSVRDKLIVDGRESEILAWDPNERVFSVGAGEAVRARIATFYYPHWRATFNGEPINLELAEDGAMLVPLNSNEGVVRIWFQEPLRNELGLYLSILCWLCFGAAGLFLFCKWFTEVRRKRLPA